jgi:hypothetical protein
MPRQAIPVQIVGVGLPYPRDGQRGEEGTASRPPTKGAAISKGE